MKALVTGGAGFIGSHIVDQLISNGAKVKVIDNLSTGSIKNINSKADFIKCDITNSKMVKKIMHGCDTIFHLAAFTSVPLSFLYTKECKKVNQSAFNNILMFASQLNVKKIVFSSTSAVYSDNQRGPCNEKTLVAPSSPYGKSKIYGEKELYKWSKEKNDRSGTVLRYFNVYGPRQEADSDYASVIPKFISQIEKKEPVSIYGDGKQTRDFVFVDDVVSANLLTCGLSNYSTYVVGTGVETSVIKLVKLLEMILSCDIDRSYSPLPKGDAISSCSDISKLKNIGWEISTDIHVGLIITLNK